LIVYQTLSNYSEEELLGFLGSELRSKFFDQVRSESGSDLVFDSLIRVVGVGFLDRILFEDKNRKTFVQRMSETNLCLVFRHRKESETTGAFFKAAALWADANVETLATRLGEEASYQSYSRAAKPIQGVRIATPNFGLFEYQRKIVEAIHERLNVGKKRLLVHLPTGAGKTRVALRVVSDYLNSVGSGVVLWLADREELCSQAADGFLKCWSNLGNRELSCYSMFSDSQESLSGIGDGFVVASIQRLTSVRKKEGSSSLLHYKDLVENVGLVIFDEAHKAIAPKYEQVVRDFLGALGANVALVGLSATPGRSLLGSENDDEDRKLAELFGNEKVSMSLVGYPLPIRYLENSGYLARPTFKKIEYKNAPFLGQRLRSIGETDLSSVSVLLAEDAERNSCLLDSIVLEVERGALVICFAASVLHAQLLAATLCYRGIKSVSVDSGTDSAESRRVKVEKYKKREVSVLVNFGVFVAGFDAPKTNVVFVARPVNSLVQYMQMIGRGMRGVESGGNKDCTIYTVVDDLPEYLNVYRAFEHWDKFW